MYAYFAIHLIITIEVRSTDKTKVEKNVINIFLLKMLFSWFAKLQKKNLGFPYAKSEIKYFFRLYDIISTI